MLDDDNLIKLVSLYQWASQLKPLSYFVRRRTKVSAPNWGTACVCFWRALAGPSWALRRCSLLMRTFEFSGFRDKNENKLGTLFEEW